MTNQSINPYDINVAISDSLQNSREVHPKWKKAVCFGMPAFNEVWKFGLHIWEAGLYLGTDLWRSTKRCLLYWRFPKGFRKWELYFFQLVSKSKRHFSTDKWTSQVRILYLFRLTSFALMNTKWHHSTLIGDSMTVKEIEEKCRLC